jgi:RimJ/RimL family protein N-acetyltransferase
MNRKSLLTFLLISFALAWLLFSLPLAFKNIEAFPSIMQICFMIAMWSPGLGAILATPLVEHHPRGYLRRLRRSDLGSFQAYRNIPELGRYQGWLPMGDLEALAFLVEMEVKPLFQPGQWVQLGIADPHTDTLVGDIGIHLSSDSQTGEVGITLAPSEQGRGIASAAMREALQLFFTATKVMLVYGITDARNTPSVRLLKRLGFEYRETRKTVFRGEECMEQVYVLARVKANKSTGTNDLSSTHSGVA